jgi:hypothetical protein
MEERQLEESRENAVLNANLPVPAARPLSDFCMERVGDDVVLYDPVTSRYHTLNVSAFDIWRLCDGTRTAEQIGIALQRNGFYIEAIEAAVAQLGESGLLQAPDDRFEARVYRRKLLKLAIAGAVGAAVLPVVKSITVPDAAAAVSNGQPCSVSSQCDSGCCRNGGVNVNTCVPLSNPNQCFPN